MSYARYNGLSGGGGGGGSGVTSLNSLTGALTLAAGTGIGITPSGSTITISATNAGNVVGPGTSIANGIATYADTTGELLLSPPNATIDSSGIGYFNELYVGGPSGVRLFDSGGQLVTPSVFVLGGAISLSSGMLVQSNFIRYDSAGGLYPILYMNQDASGPAFQLDTGSGAYVTNNLLNVNNNGITQFSVGNTGIATATALDTAAFKLTTSPTAGFVLTSDSSGNGTWQATGQPSAEYAFGNSGATPAIDFNNGVSQALTLNSATVTPTFANPVNGNTYLFRLTQDGTGGRLVTWPAGVLWQGMTAPVLSTGAAAIDIVTLYYNGTDYYGTYGANYG